jgi:uncharacterized membrane protein YagU involved in acid resistance
MLTRILTGTLIVGILDLADAFLFFYFRSGTRPERILQSIAAGVQGRSAFSGGMASAGLGLLLHFTVALCIVITCALVVKALPGLRQHVVRSGIVFGVAAYFVMQYVVVPLSATSRGPFVWPVFLNGLLIHAFGVGIPAMLSVTRARR